MPEVLPVMLIRRYNPGEEDAVWQVFYAATRESIARDYHPELIDHWAPRERDANQWISRLAQTNPFVAVEDGQIVGMAEIAPDGYIDYFYVHPQWQGRGVGQALLATLEAEASRLAVALIFANVSITARTFFLAQGFVVTEEKSKVILGHPVANFRMQKVLPSLPRDGASTDAKRQR